MADARLEKIREIACRLFICEGYSRTQIRDIAKAAGISVGAVYLLFTGKKAILDYVLKCGIDPSFRDREHELPIGEEGFSSLQNELMVAYYKSGIRFAEPLTTGMDAYPFDNLLFDAFDSIAGHGDCSLIFENNPHSCGKLDSFYVQYRQRFADTFLRFVQTYMESGQIRPLQHPRHSVRLMVETLFYWAVRILYADPEEAEQLSYDDRKTICMDALVNAYQA